MLDTRVGVRPVPHQAVEMRDVDEQRVAGPAPSDALRTGSAAADRVRCRRAASRRCASLSTFSAVIEPVRAVLEQDHVEFLRRDLIGRDLVHVVAPRQHADLARVAGRMRGLVTR